MTGIPSSLPTNLGVQGQSASAQNVQQQQQQNNDDLRASARSESAPVSNQTSTQEASPVQASNADNASTNATEQRGTLIDIQV